MRSGDDPSRVGGWRQRCRSTGCILMVFLECVIVERRSKPTDIFAIGFEEMVELNAGNIVNAR